jgi:NADH:ubiquinone oxidoreductase subunit 4 (subunit M)
VIIPEERIGGGIGLMTASYGLAGFLLPYMVSALRGFGLGINPIFGIGALVSVLSVILQFAAFSEKQEDWGRRIAYA